MKNGINETIIRAREWDVRPNKVFNFTGRVLKKYGLEKIREKLSFANKEYYDSVDKARQYAGRPYAVQMSEASAVKEAINDAVANNADLIADESNAIVDMEVPTLYYEKWLNSIPMKDTVEYKKRRLMLAEYLNTFSEYERSKVIKIMCQDTDSNNYVSFLDMDPSYMNLQQKLIFKDIIKFYDEKIASENAEKEALWKQLEQSTIDAKHVALAKKESIVDENDNDYVDTKAGKLASILAEKEQVIDQNENFEDNLNIENKKTIDNLQDEVNELVRKQSELERENQELIAKRSQDIHSVLMQQEMKMRSGYQAQPNVKTFDLGSNNKIKTLMFSPQTTSIRQNQIFGASNVFEPTGKHFDPRGYILSHDTIAKVGYNTNIKDLIEERNAVALANQQLVDEIVRNQIAYNNSFIKNGSFAHGANKLSNANHFAQSLSSIRQANMIARQQEQKNDQPMSIFTRKLSLDNGSIVKMDFASNQQQKMQFVNHGLTSTTENQFNSASMAPYDTDSRIVPTLKKKSSDSKNHITNRLNSNLNMNQVQAKMQNPNNNSQIDFNSASTASYDNELRIKPNLVKRPSFSYKKDEVIGETNLWKQPKYLIQPKKISENKKVNNDVNIISNTSLYKNPNIRNVENKQTQPFINTTQYRYSQQTKMQTTNNNKNEKMVGKEINESIYNQNQFQQQVANVNREKEFVNKQSVNNETPVKSRQKEQISLKKPVLVSNNGNFVEPSKNDRVYFHNISESEVKKHKRNETKLNEYVDPQDVVGMYKLNVKNKKDELQKKEEEEKSKIMVGQFVPTKKID